MEKVQGKVTEERIFKDEDVDFITEEGVRVMKSDPPSREACERFIDVVLDIKARKGI